MFTKAVVQTETEPRRHAAELKIADSPGGLSDAESPGLCDGGRGPFHQSHQTAHAVVNWLQFTDAHGPVKWLTVVAGREV